MSFSPPLPLYSSKPFVFVIFLSTYRLCPKITNVYGSNILWFIIIFYVLLIQILFMRIMEVHACSYVVLIQKFAISIHLSSTFSDTPRTLVWSAHASFNSLAMLKWNLSN